MRPLHLDIKAFGPYAGHQAIDFSELRDYRFFLIHGPTGSGKTALLDAMCYALYGDTSGKVRSGENMRSDYAADTELTEVIFDFAVGQDFYRVRRSPKQWVARKRGAGLLETGESASLIRLDDARQEVTALAEKTQRVTAEIQRILGFRSDQFRQVVLLPQGDFRRLLLADSAERQEIMQTLFRTEHFGLIEQRLKEEVKAWAEKFAGLEAKLQELQTLSGVESMAELQEQIKKDEHAVDALHAEIAQASTAVTMARKLLAEAQRDRQAFDEKQAAALASEALQVEEDAIMLKRIELHRALQAAEVNESAAIAQERNRDREKATVRWNESEAELTAALLLQDTAVREWEGIKTREPEMDRWVQELNRLEELRTQSAALSDSRAHASLLRLEADAAAGALKKAETEMAMVQLAMEDLQKKEARALLLAAETGGREASLKQWKNLQERRKKVDKLQSELMTADKKLAAAIAAENEGRFAWEEEQARLEMIREQWEREQAALLAASLEEGVPCPVCGSTAHPSKALPVRNAPDQAAMRRQKQKVEESAKTADAARQQEFTARGERDRAAHSMNLLIEELGDFAQWELPRLEQAVEEACRASEEAALAQAEVGALRQQGDVLLQKLEAAKRDRAAKERRRTDSESKAQASEAVAAEREKAVPEGYRDIKRLEQAIISVRSQLATLRGLLEKSQQRVVETGNLLAQAQAQLDERKNAAERAQDAWGQAEKEKRLRIAEAGFWDEADYGTAIRGIEVRTELEQMIRDFDGRRAAAHERLERASQAALQITESPDLAAKETDYTLANSLEQALRVEEGRIHDRLKQTRGFIARFVELDSERMEAEEKHALFTGLYEIAAGRFTGVSFERYVLGFLLDEVSLFANLRLKEMTRGRYRLRRRENREDKRKGAGLDLEVLDGYTGEARPVQTLSGGETFLASLSLALGLADVVQSRSGGIHLETLFVDEGFGTLDPETLDLAIKALLDLQQGGRLVGIISHVPELRDSIDARLEIIPVERGSRAEFHVG